MISTPKWNANVDKPRLRRRQWKGMSLFRVQGFRARDSEAHPKQKALSCVVVEGAGFEDSFL